MPKKPTLSPEDKALFEKAMKDVTPLKYKKNKAPFSKQPSKPYRNPTVSETEHSTIIALSDPQELTIYAETVLSFHRGGLNERLLKKLRRGEFIVSAVLDMHHYTIEQARTALSEFLQQSIQQEFRFVRIIHGKGQREHNYARLKTFINHWLPQFDFVLAFHSCPPAQGGTGAVNVLLRKQ